MASSGIGRSPVLSLPTHLELRKGSTELRQQPPHIDYMAAMHGPWLTIRHDDLQREALKRRFGCYGAKEQPKWPDVTRRAGIPSLVVVAPDGAELVFEARDQLEKLGPAAVAKWPTWS